MTDSSRYLFLHIPKTAGTSVLNVLRTRFTPAETMESVDSTFDHQDIEGLASYRLLAGHFKWDQIRCFPDRKIFTFLREPVDQVMSKYYYLRHRTVSDEPVDVLCRRLSLAEVLEDDTIDTMQFRNSYVWQLSGVAPDVRKLGREAFDSAVKALDRCDFVGIYEEIEDSLDLMCCTFGWPFIDQLPRDNVTKERRRVTDLDAHTLDRIRELNALDLELYQYARQLYRTRKRASFRAAAGERSTGDGVTGSTPVRRPEWRPGPPEVSPYPSLHIVAVDVEGRHNHTPVVQSGNPVRISVVALAGPSAVKGTVLEIRIQNRYHQTIFGCATDQQGETLTVQPHSACRATFVMDARLAPGPYTILVSAYGGTAGIRQRLQDLAEAATFEVAEGFPHGKFEGPVDLRPGIFMQPDLDCAEIYHLGEKIDFSYNGQSERYAGVGWDRPEDWGRWTVREEAHLLMKIAPPCSDLVMTAALMPFCPEQRPDIAVDIVVNNTSLDTWHFTGSDGTERSTVIPHQILGEVLHVLFLIREPRIPEVLGLGPDARALGIGVHHLQIACRPVI